MKTFKQYFEEAIENEKIMYISRGIPGSGKSHTISQVVPKDNIFSTDDFWGPFYRFDINYLGQAHKWNENRAKKAVKEGLTPVGIDNTNITWDAMKPYVEMAKDNGYIVKYLEADSPWWREISSNLEDPDFKEGNPEFEKAAEFLFKNNVHKVPLEVIKRMLKAWQPTKSLPK